MPKYRVNAVDVSKHCRNRDLRRIGARRTEDEHVVTPMTADIELILSAERRRLRTSESLHSFSRVRRSSGGRGSCRAANGFFRKTTAPLGRNSALANHFPTKWFSVLEATPAAPQERRPPVDPVAATASLCVRLVRDTLRRKS